MGFWEKTVQNRRAHPKNTKNFRSILVSVFSSCSSSSLIQTQCCLPVLLVRWVRSCCFFHSMFWLQMGISQSATCDSFRSVQSVDENWRAYYLLQKLACSVWFIEDVSPCVIQTARLGGILWKFISVEQHDWASGFQCGPSARIGRRRIEGKLSHSVIQLCDKVIDKGTLSWANSVSDMLAAVEIPHRRN